MKLFIISIIIVILRLNSHSLNKRVIYSFSLLVQKVDSFRKEANYVNSAVTFGIIFVGDIKRNIIKLHSCCQQLHVLLQQLLLL